MLDERMAAESGALHCNWYVTHSFESEKFSKPGLRKCRYVILRTMPAHMHSQNVDSKKFLEVYTKLDHFTFFAENLIKIRFFIENFLSIA